MRFTYAPSIHRDFPELATRVLSVEGLTPNAPVADPVARFIAMAQQRIAHSTESDLPEIQAWRRAFGKMGLKPTQYRCAAEALLRRLRKEGALLACVLSRPAVLKWMRRGFAAAFVGLGVKLALIQR
ncbi:hypothetical protein G7047_08050 [Diaphorobacter sp. HDW4A]|nr:hypothetical protein G7047_08050 [Diaphorobacter sp. HDW4A]